MYIKLLHCVVDFTNILNNTVYDAVTLTFRRRKTKEHILMQYGTFKCDNILTSEF